MAKDYNKKRTVKPRSKLPRQLLGMLLFFLLGYLTATVFDYESLSHWFSKTLKNAYQDDKQPPTIAAAPKPKELPKPKFEFYTLLSNDNKHLTTASNYAPRAPAPNKPVVVPDKALINPLQETLSNQSSSLALNKEPIIRKSGYLIQVAAFNKRQDAEKLKASLVLRGFDVSISNIAQRNITWYRVVIGPFNSRGDAEKAQINVAQNDHIKGMIRKIEG